MLEEFKNIYDIHGWLRGLTWAGLLCMALFLSWSLRLAMLGAVQVHPFMLFAVLSALWCILCGFVLWFSATLLRHHLKQWRILDRRRFKRVDEEWLAARESFLNHPEALYDALQPFPLAMEYAGNGHGRASGDPLAGLRLPQKQQRAQEKVDAKPIVLHTSDHISEVPTRPISHHGILLSLLCRLLPLFQRRLRQNPGLDGRGHACKHNTHGWEWLESWP